MLRRGGQLAMQFVCADETGRTLDYRTCEVSRMVAVLAALGIPVATEKVLRDIEGDERITYLHGPVSLHTCRPGLNAKETVRDYKNGTLARLDPHHPFLDGLRALANMRALRDWTLRNQPQALGLCCPERCLYSPAAAPVKPKGEVRGLKSVHRAAAFALLGYPVTEIRQHEGKPIYYLDTVCHLLSDEVTEPAPCVLPPTLDEIFAAHKADKLPPEHPFVIAFDSCIAFDRLMQTVEDEIAIYMFRKRGTTMATFVREDASSKAFEESDAFLLGH